MIMHLFYFDAKFALFRPFSGLDWNELSQLWNIARYIYVPCFRCVVNSIPDRTFLSVRYKNRISKGVQVNATHIKIVL